MKRNTTPELSAKWWSTNQPDGLAAAKDLEKALADYESARARLDKNPADDAQLAAGLKALTQLEALAKKAADEAARFVKTPPKKTESSADDYQNTADALKKIPRVAEDARRAMQALSDASATDDEEADGGLLGDEEAYKRYLKKVMGRLQTRSMNFAIGLGKTAAEHRFLFHASKGGKSLSADLKKGGELKRFAWGVAGAHQEKPGVLVLALESPPAAGLGSKAPPGLKAFKPLPFGKVMLLVDGEEAADIPDPDEVDEPGLTADAPESGPPGVDPAPAFKARLTALLGALQQAVATRHPAAAQARARATEAGERARQQDYDGASRLLDEVEALLSAPAPSAPASPSASAVGGDAGALPGIAAWVSERDRVLGEVRKVAAAFAATKDPMAKPAIIELQSIIKNLTPTPATPQQVAEIERYLKEDDVISAAEQVRPPFGTLSIRRPLLRALMALRA